MIGCTPELARRSTSAAAAAILPMMPGGTVRALEVVGIKQLFAASAPRTRRGITVIVGLDRQTTFSTKRLARRAPTQMFLIRAWPRHKTLLRNGPARGRQRHENEPRLAVPSCHGRR